MNEQEGIRCPKYDKCATLMNVEAILYTVNTSFMKKRRNLRIESLQVGSSLPPHFLTLDDLAIQRIRSEVNLRVKGELTRLIEVPVFDSAAALVRYKANKLIFRKADSQVAVSQGLGQNSWYTIYRKVQSSATTRNF